MGIIRVENLVKYYGTEPNQVKAVNDVSFDVQKGEFICIVGKSGSGKTTLLHLIGGLEKESSGRVFIAEKEVGSMSDEELSVFRRRKIGFVFQSYNLLPFLNVHDNITLPIGLDGEKIDQDFLEEVVTIFELQDKLRCYPKKLSGGEQQRVAIARAIITNPTLILADEPTGNLDSETSENVLMLLEKTAKSFEQTIIMVTHNEAVARRADRTIHFKSGEISKIV
jgi:putative ABC transport system ATP-binding protein